ncbi:hypothetical protein ACFL2V_01020, partial [Pseudomonadota bacterium]
YSDLVLTIIDLAPKYGLEVSDIIDYLSWPKKDNLQQTLFGEEESYDFKDELLRQVKTKKESPNDPDFGRFTSIVAEKIVSDIAKILKICSHDLLSRGYILVFLRIRLKK